MNHTFYNKIVFITGATSGIGEVAAIYLAQMGATVVATARNNEKGKQLASKFKNNYPQSKGSLEVISCDLSSLKSVTNAAKQFREKYKKIDILINNAGVYNSKFKLSKDGIEDTFQVNVLSPLLLTLLFEQMIIENKGRIINTSSSFHHGNINFNDLNGRRFYSGLNAYRQSKLAEILLSKIINQRFSGTGAAIYCQHPGIVRTNLGKNNSLLFNFGLRLIGKSPQQGAETLLYIAASPSTELISGEYYANKRRWKTKPQSNNMVLAEKLFSVAFSYIEQFIEQYTHDKQFIVN